MKVHLHSCLMGNPISWMTSKLFFESSIIVRPNFIVRIGYLSLHHNRMFLCHGEKGTAHIPTLMDWQLPGPDPHVVFHHQAPPHRPLVPHPAAGSISFQTDLADSLALQLESSSILICINMCWLETLPPMLCETESSVWTLESVTDGFYPKVLHYTVFRADLLDYFLLVNRKFNPFYFSSLQGIELSSAFSKKINSGARLDLILFIAAKNIL